MRDLFLPVPKDQRQAKLREYGDYLVERDGVVDIAARTLSKREESIHTYEARPAVTAAIDEPLFRRLYAKFDKNERVSKEMLLLLSLVKVNSAEAYGVERNFQNVLKRAGREHNESLLRILCEETYHTRILLSAANHYGITVDQAYRPPSALRILISGIATTPDVIALPLTLAGEIVATLMFTKLLMLVPSLLAHAPEIRDAVEQRLIDICTDEHGHISYNRLQAGPADFAELRMILPITARVMRGVFPEMVALGAYPMSIWDELPLIADPKLIPAAVRSQAYLA
jgi:hypothetical protein